MSYIAVNYHYIRPERSPGFYPCAIDTFERQLGHFSRTHEMVSLSELWTAAKKESRGNFCSLTFDDGMREHHEVVLPRLQKAKAKGTFFPIGLPLKEKKIPQAHRLHVVLSLMSIQEVVRRFHSFFQGRYAIPDSTFINPERSFEDVLTANLKETLIRIAWSERCSFMEHIFRECCSDEEAMTSRLFMSPEEVSILQRSGMEIGSHGYEHFSYDAITPSLQREDITKGQAVLKDILGKPPTVFSYPHGKWTEGSLSILQENGISIACVLGGREVQKGDNPLLLPRFDTNDIRV